MATKDISDIQVLKAYNECSGNTLYPYEYLQIETGECKKVCYAAMKRCEDRGYIDCGVSLRNGWITEKGFKFLAESEDSNE